MLWSQRTYNASYIVTQILMHVERGYAWLLNGELTRVQRADIDNAVYEII